MTVELASTLVDTIFRTLFIYDDRRSRKAVDDVIIKSLNEVIFMKSFAGAVVQAMEKQLKVQSHVGCYRLLNWSVLLLTKSQFSSVSKNAVSRVASAQAGLVNLVMQRSFRERRACKRIFFHLFSQSPDIYKTYIEELKNGRVAYKESPELIRLLLEFSSASSSRFEQCKSIFMDIYLKAVLNAREKPVKELSECFHPLFRHLSHEDFQNVVLPSSVKMLKRNPEIVLEAVGVLLESVNLDLSKYGIELLSVVLSQVRHADEGRRVGALAIVRCLSQKSSNPDALEAMFNAVKAIIGGSEGRLQFPYQRTGMFNAVQELSHAPDGKFLNSLVLAVCSFLLSCYKEEGNEEVKLAILSAIASWAARSADSVQLDLVSFIAAGLKEKEVLRRGHLRCLQVICKNADAVLQVSSLFGPLVQLVKTGFTKAVQRLDGVYALLVVGKIASTDIKAEETLAKEKIWSFISQNEPSLVPISLASKLSNEDCMACVDLLEVLLVEHSRRVLEAFSVKLLFQLLVFLLCHPSWDVRKMSYAATRKIINAIPLLSELLLLEFTNFLSVVGERLSLLGTSDSDNSLDAQVAFLPSVEVLVKALAVISCATLAASPSVSTQVILCSHHPCMVGTAKRDVVWKRLLKCLRRLGIDVIGIVSADVENLCKGLLGPMGLASLNPLEQEAAIYSLSTLMSITPRDMYLAFEKQLKNLPDRYAHDMLSESDIRIFHTPEGMLSSEQGVYVAESVASKNTRQAKGRFRMYEDHNDTDDVNSNQFVKREPTGREAAGMGRKDIGKSTKKADKGKTAKEEARELLLKEEAAVRDKVRGIQDNLSLMLRALGEMAISNPVFAHSQLPSLIKFVDPLLQSPIVSDVAYETLVKLSRCTAAPLPLGS